MMRDAEKNTAYAVDHCNCNELHANSIKSMAFKPSASMLSLALPAIKCHSSERAAKRSCRKARTSAVAHKVLEAPCWGRKHVAGMHNISAKASVPSQVPWNACKGSNRCKSSFPEGRRWPGLAPAVGMSTAMARAAWAPEKGTSVVGMLLAPTAWATSSSWAMVSCSADTSSSSGSMLITLSRRRCITNVESLYESSDTLSNSAMPSSKAFRAMVAASCTLPTSCKKPE
mmetsp:Transcript_98476/g.301270  ORF Transcript_98476/g.301270 Transcript_98476/m.301270 type:complete len:229 (+) Transcript_98476:231-917(+)